MASITVNLTRQRRHWQIQIAVDGEIKPANVFGCSDGLLPLITGLERAEAQAHAIVTSPDSNMGGLPPTITVGMPSGRVLTFRLSSLQESLAHTPETIPAFLRGRSAR
jgi:hypothetical protein